jgi:hypothetical protein
MSVMVFVVIPVLLVLLGAFAASIAWVWRDANRRGQPGFIVAVLVAFLFWPLSLIVWLAARPGVPAAATTPGRGGHGCLWSALVLLVVIGIMAAAILLGIALPSIAKARESAGHARCLNNVRQIAVAYVAFREQHGRCPVTLSDLHMNPACPDARRRSLPLPTNSILSLVSYELLPGTNATDIIVREYWGNHSGKGGAIAFGDGSVAWVDSPYQPLRMDVVRAGVEKQLRQKLGDEFIKVGAMTFNAQENRYDIGIVLNINGEFRRTLDLSQIGAKEQERRGQDQKRLQEFLTRSARHAVRWDRSQDLSSYAGSLELDRRQGTYLYSIVVDELMEREPQVEKELP